MIPGRLRCAGIGEGLERTGGGGSVKHLRSGRSMKDLSVLKGKCFEGRRVFVQDLHYILHAINAFHP
jgi:hypothetical protein